MNVLIGSPTCLQLLTGFVLAIATASVLAQNADVVFVGADRKAGAVLHQEKNCASCHARSTGGDGSGIYTRIDRKVTTPSKLLAQVAMCNTRLGGAMFPDDERDVAAFLNHDYYHFK